MEPWPWYLRLLCLAGLHCWRYFPAAPDDPPYVLGRRTCTRCGAWCWLSADESGWSGGNWRPF